VDLEPLKSPQKLNTIPLEQVSVPPLEKKTECKIKEKNQHDCNEKVVFVS